MKYKTSILCIVLFIIAVLFSVHTSFAHPGRTDSNGGHWNHSTGTYHYHTGEYAGRNSSINDEFSLDGYDYEIPRISVQLPSPPARVKRHQFLQGSTTSDTDIFFIFYLLYGAWGLSAIGGLSHLVFGWSDLSSKKISSKAGISLAYILIFVAASCITILPVWGLHQLCKLYSTINQFVNIAILLWSLLWALLFLLCNIFMFIPKLERMGEKITEIFFVKIPFILFLGFPFSTITITTNIFEKLFDN